MPRPFDPDAVAASSPWESRCRWSGRDVALYNLGIGFGGAALADPRLLPYVTEEAARSFPTMASVIGFDRGPVTDPACGIDLAGTLHGEESVEIFADLPAAGEAMATVSVVGVWDKGPGRGAILALRRALATDAGKTLAIARSTIMLRNNGGFGGSGEGAPRARSNPEREPDGLLSAVTAPEQALLFRFSGDHNPLHADPAVARRAGFDRPILMGLCSFGIAGRILAEALGNGRRLRALGMRFAGVVYPGETLRIGYWHLDDGEIAFEARVAERDTLALVGGRARFA